MSESESFIDALLWARLVASEQGANEIRPEHLVIGMFRGPSLVSGHENVIEIVLGVPSLGARIAEMIGQGDVHGNSTALQQGDVPLNESARAVLKKAEELAREGGRQSVGALHILLAIIRLNAFPSARLNAAGLTTAIIERALGRNLL
jgi:ATP-dependent Clp protease ATP-binding subunit ClpA